jgi:hypothetical protein
MSHDVLRDMLLLISRGLALISTLMLAASLLRMPPLEKKLLRISGALGLVFATLFNLVP